MAGNATFVPDSVLFRLCHGREPASEWSLEAAPKFMDKAMAVAVSPILASKKAAARAALVGVNDPAKSLLIECFRQFGIETKVLDDNAAAHLQKEKYEACVVRMGPAALPVMESARTSASNSRIVLFAIGGTAKEALKYSKVGINAIFHEPLERPSVLKLVRATQMLVLHELRRYVRIPIITEISLAGNDGRKVTATSIEISSGGMSMRSGQEIASGQAVEISFSLLTLPRMHLRGTVTWKNPGSKAFGVRFDATDERRLKVKEWIDAYLEN